MLVFFGLKEVLGKARGELLQCVYSSIMGGDLRVHSAVRAY